MAKEISAQARLIANQLHSNAIHLLRKVRREDAGSGLNAPRLSALSVIVFGGPLTLGELARAEQVRPPTMTRIVNALQKDGFVTKKKNRKDGRLTHITPTVHGRRLLRQGRERRVRALAAKISLLNAGKRQTLLRAIKILEEVVRAV